MTPSPLVGPGRHAGDTASPADPVQVPEVTAGGTPQAGGIATRVLRHGAVYAIANFSIKALNFLLLPLYTRFLTPADYGVISLAETLAVVVATVAGQGLTGGLRRLYFEHCEQPQELKSFVGSVFRFGLVVNLAALAFSLAAGPWLFSRLAAGFSVPFQPYIALAIATAMLSQLVDFRLVLYQAEGRPRSYAAFTGGFFLATTGALVGLVVATRGGALGFLGGKALAALAACAAAAGLLWPWLRGAARWSFVRETLPIALPLVPHQLMAVGLAAADRLILERYTTLTDIGLYSLAYSFGMVMSLVTLSMAQAWGPIFFDVARQGEAARAALARVSTALAVLLVGAGTFGSLIARDVVELLLDPRYHGAAPLIPWIIAGYVLHGFFSLFHLSAVQGKRPMRLLYASLFAFAINIALNLWWVPLYGARGAAWATTAAYAAEAALMYFYAQKTFALPYRVPRLLLSLGVLAGAVAVTQVGWPEAGRRTVTLAALLASGAALWAIGGSEMWQSLRQLVRPADRASDPSRVE